MRTCCIVQKPLLFIPGVITVALLYNEWLVYVVVLLTCQWPKLNSANNSSPTRAMFIADTHLLGPNGHWLDRLRREWQMERAFQTALALHQPELVFILGDLFDEGKWSSDQAFNSDVKRFNQMFRHPSSVTLIAVIGNHDVGFHYMIDDHRLKRFVKAVNSSDSLQMIMHKDVIFVTANSMAFEGDECSMCSRAVQKLKDISEQLQCSKTGYQSLGCKTSKTFLYSRPVLLQHYPMYRKSDAECSGPDSAPANEKQQIFKPKFDCLSETASKLLMSSLEPRLIIGGHTHHFCHRVHDGGIPEWSIPSFSWRNKKASSFLMVTISAEEFAVTKCFMPDENTVYNIYICSGLLAVIYLLTCTVCFARRKLSRRFPIKPD